VLGHREAVEHHLQPGAVVVGVTDHDCAQQFGTVLGDNQLFVDLTTFVDE